ncbi:hypothetical protein EDD17DRAFT_1763968 [Pisolithus thermaeus]|nr:hypothetical protein EDD17DRAFT_1763968 [Pisolithus thermaeus]
MIPVLQQPTASLMPAKFSESPYPSDKKCGGIHASQRQIDHYNHVDQSKAHCQCSQTPSYRASHKAWLRKILVLILLMFLLLGAVILVWCMTNVDLFEMVLGGDGDAPSLVKRQSSESSFKKKKLYLIIIFVGLFLVVVAGIALSFWCCRGAFENPLCFPCYLSACCGGLDKPLSASKESDGERGEIHVPEEKLAIQELELKLSAPSRSIEKTDCTADQVLYEQGVIRVPEEQLAVQELKLDLPGPLSSIEIPDCTADQVLYMRGVVHVSEEQPATQEFKPTLPAPSRSIEITDCTAGQALYERGDVHAPEEQPAIQELKPKLSSPSRSIETAGCAGVQALHEEGVVHGLEEQPATQELEIKLSAPSRPIETADCMASQVLYEQGVVCVPEEKPAIQELETRLSVSSPYIETANCTAGQDLYEQAGVPAEEAQPAIQRLGLPLSAPSRSTEIADCTGSSALFEQGVVCVPEEQSAIQEPEIKLSAPSPSIKVAKRTAGQDLYEQGEVRASEEQPATETLEPPLSAPSRPLEITDCTAGQDICTPTLPGVSRAMRDSSPCEELHESQPDAYRMYSRNPYEGPSHKLVLAFDIGTSFSSISYCKADPGESPVILGVDKFPGQDHASSCNRIPSTMYYDKEGRVQAIGAETQQLHIIEKAGKEGWVRLEWWKLHLRSKHLEASHFSNANLPPLPNGKLAVEVLGDFMRYLFDCAETYIKEVDADITWDSLEDRIEFILTHPNGWEGPQQQQIRKAVELAGLIPVGEEGQSRVHLLTEGEASLHFYVTNFLTSETFEAMPIASSDEWEEDDSGSVPEYQGVIIIDAGGGTVDLSAYTMKLFPTSFREIAPAECRLQGSVFVTHRAHAFLRALLANSKYGDEDTLKRMADVFDKTTKLQFRDADEPQYIKFGTIHDEDPEYNIHSGQLELSGQDVARLFEPSVEEIISAFEVQRKAASMPISRVFLVGGFAANDWLHYSLSKHLESLGIALCRPGSQHVNKADGVVSYRLDHLVSSRAARFTYGIPCNFLYNPCDMEHVSRRSTVFTALRGDLRVPNGFGSILIRGTEVSEEQEFREAFYRENANLSACKSLGVDIVAYRGTLENPLWMDKEKESYTKLCTIFADTSKLTASLQPHLQANGMGFCYILDFDVVMLFGLTELKAQISWKENGVEVRSPATVVYDCD